MSNNTNIVIISTIIISIAVHETMDRASATELPLAGRRDGNAPRLAGINDQPAADARNSIYIEIAGTSDGRGDDEAGGMSRVELVRYDKAEFETRYFADAEPVPGMFANGPRAGTGAD